MIRMHCTVTMIDKVQKKNGSWKERHNSLGHNNSSAAAEFTWNKAARIREAILPSRYPSY